jgi:pimeloyl-ACP methyl ester carboxylesterase
MIQRLPFLFTLLTSAFLSCAASIRTPHTTEEITFLSDRFEIAGDLRVPKTEGKHPVVVMVHGDGPNNRTSYGTYLPLMNCFLDAGYACFSWDKPGSGKSKGKIDRDHLQRERVQIVLDAINALKSKPSIDSTRIGLWGISQAGYVMPLALGMTNDIAFMICVGCPGQAGIHQTAYLIRKQLLCEGMPENQARQAEEHFAALFFASTYQEYLKHAKPLVETPLVKRMGFVSGIWSQQEWAPHDQNGEGFFNPITVIEKTTIPVLAFFGEKDTQVNHLQGSEAYTTALRKAGNHHFRIEIIPNADHNLILCETGCMSERNKRSVAGWKNYAPEYLNILEEWLRELSKSYGVVK